MKGCLKNASRNAGALLIFLGYALCACLFHICLKHCQSLSTVTNYTDKITNAHTVSLRPHRKVNQRNLFFFSFQVELVIEFRMRLKNLLVYNHKFISSSFLSLCKVQLCSRQIGLQIKWIILNENYDCPLSMVSKCYVITIPFRVLMR